VGHHLLPHLGQRLACEGKIPHLAAMSQDHDPVGDLEDVFQPMADDDKEAIPKAPLRISQATITPVSAVMEPTERSMPPVMITRISPMPRMPKVAMKRMMMARLAGLTKTPGFCHQKKAQRMTRAISTFNSRKPTPKRARCRIRGIAATEFV
jgi:hypothetical protein